MTHGRFICLLVNGMKFGSKASRLQASRGMQAILSVGILPLAAAACLEKGSASSTAQIYYFLVCLSILPPDVVL